MTSPSIETRTCDTCGKPYEHEPIMSGGVDLLNHFTTCDSCTEKREQAEARSKRERKAKAAWESTVPAEYRKTDINHPDFPKHLHELGKRWLSGEDRNAKLFLGMVGESGRGKTRVVSQLVKRLIWEGESVHWVNSSQFQWSAQHQFSDANGIEATKWLRIYRKSPTLVFDDIGRLKSTEAISDALYDLLEYRTAHELPMLWTSNESLELMIPGKKITELSRKRIISRLGGFSTIVTI